MKLLCILCTAAILSGCTLNYRLGMRKEEFLTKLNKSGIPYQTNYIGKYWFTHDKETDTFIFVNDTLVTVYFDFK